MTADIQDLIGKPFKEFGRGPDGYDCWGGVIAVGSRLGVEIPDYCHLGVRDVSLILSEYERRKNDWIPCETGEVGDIVVFDRVEDGGLHFGIVVSRGWFAHVTEDLGLHRSRLDHPVNKGLIKGFYRHA